MGNNKAKIIILILLIISLILLFLYSIFGISLSFLSENKIKENRKLKANLIDNIKINNIDTVYDKNENIYYYTVPQNYENSNYVLKLELKDGFKYKIVNHFLNIIKVDYNKPIDIIIYNDKYYYETKIQLTNLPLISIESKEIITDNETNSTLKYINYNNNLSTNIKIHIRGGSSKSFDKKSYRVHTYDKDYIKEKNVLLSDLYYGSSFILDSIYRDPSKIRNTLSTELWNNISKDFTNVNIDYEFVEVFVNNEYKGLYVLIEPVNRKKLNLNKSDSNDTSVIIKSQNWETIDNSQNKKNIDTDTYLGYEIKYPNKKSFYSISWEKILTKISGYYSNNLVENNYQTIKNTWNLKNYIDIIILNGFINNEDNNLIKNNYIYMKSLSSNEVYIQPWDMEYSFGLNYSIKDKLKLKINKEDYNKIYTIFKHKNSKEINELIIKRYWELRKGILTEEYFDNLLDNYKEKLTKGATSRDSKLWYEYDVEKEIEEIRTWIHKRIKFFDQYVKDLENE